MTQWTLEQLLPFANELQAAKIQARIQYGSNVAAAKALGCAEVQIRRAVKNAERKASIHPKGREGWSPREITTAYDNEGNVSGEWLREGPEPLMETGGEDAGPARDGLDPFFIKGVSTYYDAAGEQRGQWVKTAIDHSKLKSALLAAVAAMAGEVSPCASVAAPRASQAGLLTLYTFTDYHVGMLAWRKEGGQDWDLQIAEDTGVKAMAALTAGAPESEHAIVNIQGDFLHWDGLTAITPQHGHVLDADGRFGKVVDVAIRLIRQLVAQALAKHPNVTLLICEGNHDLASSLWLRKLFAALYENEPRLTVHQSELPYYAVEWGKTLLGFHHGHLRKNEQLPALFAAQFREAWGRCPKVYIHTGHRHHKDERDHTGARVTQHPTLAARDAYAARGGWWSEREITAIHYSKAYGWAGSNNVTPEMLAA